jgi:hypothetical protein
MVARVIRLFRRKVRVTWNAPKAPLFTRMRRARVRDQVRMFLEANKGRVR